MEVKEDIEVSLDKSKKQERDLVELRSEKLGALLNLNSSEVSTGYYNLCIPDYQRIYSWEEKNVFRLLEDINIHGDKEYHMGSIILHERRNTEGNTIAYDLVDGQQRLVTLSLLLHELGRPHFDLLNESFESKKARDYIAYNRWLIKNYLKKEKNRFNENLILKNLNFSVLILRSNNLDLAYTFFNNENAKGKPLSDYDLLKSHHLRFIQIPEQAEHAAERWHRLLQESDNDDYNKPLGRVFEIYLFRLRKWLRKRNWDETAKRKIKTEFEAAPVISNIAPFGEKFSFYESIQGGAHFFAYAEIFINRFHDFRRIPVYSLLHRYLSWEKHWWYRDVMEALIFAYYLKFGNLYMYEASIKIIKFISQHRYNTSRAYLKSVLSHASDSEIVMMIEQATSPTFFLAEMDIEIRKMPLHSELSGTRARFQNAIEKIEKTLVDLI